MPQAPVVLEGPPSLPQAAFQEEASGRASGRLGPWPGTHRAATLWPGPPDMQEPGPKETGTRSQLLPAPQGAGGAWEQHTLHRPELRVA